MQVAAPCDSSGLHLPAQDVTKAVASKASDIASSSEQSDTAVGGTASGGGSGAGASGSFSVSAYANWSKSNAEVNSAGDLPYFAWPCIHRYDTLALMLLLTVSADCHCDCCCSCCILGLKVVAAWLSLERLDLNETSQECAVAHCTRELQDQSWDFGIALAGNAQALRFLCSLQHRAVWGRTATKASQPARTRPPCPAAIAARAPSAR